MNASSTSFRRGSFDESPSRVVVDLVADCEDTSPTELSPPLYSAIDPDALDELFRSRSTETSDSPGHVRFSYLGYEVRVRSDGDVEISPRR
ncbi:HalOD1 output domain-containing protein [Halosimplex salinum]|uniref:HalOD1 output domain-containing protein n=1 Tax=Halosimplex salinum TaxID=1710538 RepID=UPI000F48EAC7|nr:HalOD1 output domain-containing protein [Halosimplex salinum]